MFIPCTHASLHIRNVHDAMVIFEAVRQGILPLVERRLSAAERDALHSGHVFVWEEGEHKQGLERWTDGRRWSQSRLRNEFLYYDEKLPITQEEREMKAARRAEYMAGASDVKPVFRRSDRPTKPNGLTKQTYSTLLRKEDGPGFRKWHIVAYFSSATYGQLPVVDSIDYLRHLQIPRGTYMPSRGSPGRADQVSNGSLTDDEDSQPVTPQNLTPPSYPAVITAGSPWSEDLPAWYDPSYLTTLTSPTSTISHHSSRPSTSSSKSNDHSDYEKRPSKFLFTFASSDHRLPYSSRYSPRYSPLTTEDARVLKLFSIRL